MGCGGYTARLIYRPDDGYTAIIILGLSIILSITANQIVLFFLQRKILFLQLIFICILSNALKIIQWCLNFNEN